MHSQNKQINTKATPLGNDGWGRGQYSFVTRLSRLTIDSASLSRRSRGVLIKTRSTPQASNARPPPPHLRQPFCQHRRERFKPLCGTAASWPVHITPRAKPPLPPPPPRWRQKQKQKTRQLKIPSRASYSSKSFLRKCFFCRRCSCYCC